MATFKRGAFEKDIDVPTGAAAIEAERALAWRLFVEMAFRPAICGRLNLIGELTFEGEILKESFDSLEEFKTRVHDMIAQGHLHHTSDQGSCLAFATAEMQEVVIRPFIDKWYAPFFQWSKEQAREHPDSTEYERQKALPPRIQTAMRDDWTSLRRFCRSFCRELATEFRFVPLFDLVPPETRREWIIECNQTWAELFRRKPEPPGEEILSP